MKAKISFGLCILVLIVLGCSQLSTKPPRIPRTVNIENERLEEEYLVRKWGSPSKIVLDCNDADYWIELWFYPREEAVVVIIVNGGKYHVRTYNYREELGEPGKLLPNVDERGGDDMNITIVRRVPCVQTSTMPNIEAWGEYWSD